MRDEHRGRGGGGEGTAADQRSDDDGGVVAQRYRDRDLRRQGDGEVRKRSLELVAIVDEGGNDRISLWWLRSGRRQR